MKPTEKTHVKLGPSGYWFTHKQAEWYNRWFEDQVNNYELFPKGEANPSLVRKLENLTLMTLPSFAQDQITPRVRLQTLKRGNEVPEDWLPIDWQHAGFLLAKKSLYEARPGEVVAYDLSGKNFKPAFLKEACKKLLDSIIDFYTTNYPNFYTENLKDKTVTDQLMLSTYKRKDYNDRPLELATLLAPADFTILLPGTEVDAAGNRDFYLAATTTSWAAGWKVEERTGWSMARVHELVPDWKNQPGTGVKALFNRLANDPTRIFARYSLFPQFHTNHKSLDSFLNVRDGEDFFPNHETATAYDLTIRREYQQLHSITGINGKPGIDGTAIVFTVRTYMVPLMDLPKEELELFARQLLKIESKHPAQVDYKNMAAWKPCVVDALYKAGSTRNDTLIEQLEGFVPAADKVDQAIWTSDNGKPAERIAIETQWHLY
ncbi:hypothetical protein BT63DRAFT_475321 [Microthyrium microscopicum]|uniref:Uncharacterized protein n=1 Tax=Microthyrium microscopicum TaxID=703497 RepID=A0A6A6UNQ3_9PEZI|nr:hypothetical protein BT63DRAFT_475321 [Microthyrium microscopicum]